MTVNAASAYHSAVIGPGDNVSEELRKVCIAANQDSYMHQTGVAHGGNFLIHELPKFDDALGEAQTDGVGTKVRIYMRQFNLMYEAFKRNDGSINLESFQNTSNELMYRMMLDLYAMIVDDFREGHTALYLTDIIDVNHVKMDGNDKDQGIVWANAMSYALGRVIRETGIALTAGETAILGAGDNEKAQSEIAKELLERCGNIMLLLHNQSGSMRLNGQIRDLLMAVLNPQGKPSLMEIETRRKVVEGRMELNIGGSATGVLKTKKLENMRAGDRVIALFEKKTDSGIISPRANGISAIRGLESVLGDSWTNKTIGDFFNHPTIKEKSGAMALREKFENAGISIDTKIWDVATGHTTVFNPFISRDVLGGLKGAPRFNLTGIAHMTGNPPRKGAELIGKRNLSMQIDYSQVELPQIIEMCMLAKDLTFEQGFSMWNMGIPKIITIRPDDAGGFIDYARKKGYRAMDVGEIYEPTEGETPEVEIIHAGSSKKYPVREDAMIA